MKMQKGENNMVKLTMNITRIEGHAKITVQLDDDGNVVDTRLHVMEFRGFEKFLQGRQLKIARIAKSVYLYSTHSICKSS